MNAKLAQLHVEQASYLAVEHVRKAVDQAKRQAEQAAKEAEEKARLQAEAQRKAREAEKKRAEEAAKLASLKNSFVVVEERKSFWEAEKHCREKFGTSLVSVPNKQTNDAVEAVLQTKKNPQPHWIGLNRYGTRYWHWADGEDAMHVNWTYYQNWRYFRWYNTHRWRNCGQMRTTRFYNGTSRAQVSAYNCTAKNAFICRKPGNKPTDYSVADIILPQNQNAKEIPACKVLQRVSSTFRDAMNRCKSEKNCAGLTLHGYLLKRPQIKSTIYLLKSGPECKAKRKLPAHQANYITYIKDTYRTN